ncbi:MAG: hypothetical protein AzoDbin1_03998 [Azoarcus sp.]|nr:hypothetical protein [Azoarcus sp.]
MHPGAAPLPMTTSTTNYSFSTLGQVIRFAYDACGVLPRKRGERDGLTEHDKKRIQKQLQRLADEEGRLLENGHAAIEELGALLADTVAPAKAVAALGGVLLDLFEVYNTVVRSEGTFLSERDTIGWFCRAYAIPHLVVSVRKHLLRLNVAAEGLRTPSESDWYLPTVTDEGVTWPLAKALHWTYGVCDTKQTHFHFPGMKAGSACLRQTPNLENAREWCKGRGTPSWSNLHANVAYSFERLASVEEAKYRRDIPEALRENIHLVLFVARLATDVGKSIAAAFGTDYLAQRVAQYRRHDSWLEPDLAVFRQEVERWRDEMSGTALTADEAWDEISEHYWQWFAERSRACAADIQRLLGQQRGGKLPEETIRALVAHYREYPVRSFVEGLAICGEVRTPPGFVEALRAGFDLKSRPDCSDEQIDRYEASLMHGDLAARLAWMVPWLRAVVRYRREEYEEAFPYFERAFQRAKYSAGQNQYKLVNQYIELAAKVDRWGSFKKGIEWANYLGQPVRWLRDKPPTEENLLFVFEVMKRAQYAQL